MKALSADFFLEKSQPILNTLKTSITATTVVR
jgi:hypothetical protein